jgi:vanadium chloroperoxidase
MDSILFWNDVALEANRVSHTNGLGEQTGPPLSSRALAIVHLAMYDAYAAIDATAGPFYMPGLPTPPPGAVAQAAVAGAAYTTLSTLFPSQKSFFDTKLAEVVTLPNPSYNFGVVVAQEILLDRGGDPSDKDTGYVPKLSRGKHRPDPDNPNQGFNGPFYGSGSKGFAITCRHELDEPPFDNPEYLNALRQVRGRGIAPELMGTVPNNINRRTIDQTVIGLYWGYDGSAELGTPPRLYNQIVRRLAIAKDNTEAENARLFALVNVAMGDAGILAWDQKYVYEFWRPVLGIREHDISTGPQEPQGQPNSNLSDDTDTGWLPLGAPASNARIDKLPLPKNFTPPFPAYPSGHATFGAAAFHITRLFYGPGGVNRGGVSSGDRNPDSLFDGLDFVSDEFNGVTKDNKGAVRPKHLRNFPGGLWRMIRENSISRVFLGVHWIFDGFVTQDNGDIDFSRNIGGVPLGITIAEDIFNSNMQKSTVPPRP